MTEMTEMIEMTEQRRARRRLARPKQELEADYDSVVYALSGCSECLGANDRIGPGTESFELTLEAGEVVDIVVDGYDGAGSFVLTVAPAQ